MLTMNVVKYNRNSLFLFKWFYMMLELMMINERKIFRSGRRVFLHYRGCDCA